MIQNPPFCVQIELTEGCNLRCSFCGINGIRGKANDLKFMTPEIAEAIAGEMAVNSWNSRIEFAMHGEPTLSPHALDILSIFRKHLPNAYMLMESNGGGLVKDPVNQISALFSAGLNTLALDEYNNIRLVPKIWERLAESYDGDFYLESRVVMLGALVLRYPEGGPEANPHARRPYRRLIRIAPIDSATSGTHSTLNNHAGCGLPPNDSGVGKRCAKPFRELSFRWDGSAAVCCNDWRGTLPIGHIAHHELASIWNSPLMTAIRRKLYHGRRDFGPCRGCDATSVRPGLLPDGAGRFSLLEPDEIDEALIKKALEFGPLTAPVKREWE